MEIRTGRDPASSAAWAADSVEPMAGGLVARPARKSRRRAVRVFALFAAFILVSVAFGVVTQHARADSASSPDTTAAPAVTALGPGTAVTALPGGAHATNYGNFQRWDGAWEPMSALNFSSGNWPYLVNETATSFTATRQGLSFAQGKIPGATYAYWADGIHETIRLNSSYPVPLANPSIYVPFSTTYFPLTRGNSVVLYDVAGNAVWGTDSFAGWDSASVPDRSSAAVSAILAAPGGFSLALNTTFLSNAVYPVFLDPTWTLSSSAGWGASTFANATTDVGDGSVKIGYFADNFNNNAATGWSTSGVSFSGGTMNFGSGATHAYHAASWKDLNVQFDVNFAKYHGNAAVTTVLDFGIPCELCSVPLSLDVIQYQNTVELNEGGYNVGSFSTTISTNTWYTVRLVAESNYYEIWWNGVRKVAVSLLQSTQTGGIQFTPYTVSSVAVDNVRVWNTNVGLIATPVRTASPNVPLQTEAVGTVDAYNEMHIGIRSNTVNSTSGPWTSVKADVASGILYSEPNQTELPYYQIQVVLTSGTNSTPVLTQITTTEGSPPPVVPMTNTGKAPWYLYIGGDVDAISGNLVLSSTDLSVKAKGFTMTVSRTYNSALVGTLGPFGLGTTDPYHARLSFPAGGNVTYTAGDGGAYTFVTMGGTAYSPPRGVHDSLIKNGDGTFTLWAPDGSKTNFDSTGKLTSLVDRNGNHLTLTYTNGNPTKVSDDSGLSLTFTYDASNRVTSVVDSMSRKVQYTYDGSNRLTQFKDAMGFTENYTSFDGANRLQARVDRAGHVDRFVYSNGKVTQIWVGEWNYGTGTIRWQVEAYAIAYVSATQTTATSAANATTTATFNSFGNPVSIVGPSVGCGLCRGGNATSYTWDGEFDSLTVTDGRGDTSTYTYDWMGNALSVRDALGNTTVRTYLNVQNATAFLSLLLSSKNPRGFTTSYTYYANGNPYATILPGGATSYRFYDPAGSLTRSQDFRGNSVTYGYDTHEFLTSRADANGNTTTYQNDLAGRTWNVTTPLGNTTRTVYDPDDRLASVKDAAGNTTTYAYDHRGDLTSTTDANQLTTQYVVNLTFGGMAKTIDAGGNTTTSVYNFAGDLIRVTDAAGSTTTYVRDAYHRETSETSQLGFLTKFVYDAAGNTIARTDANGSTTRYAYDALNRLLRTTYPDGAVVNQSYDADGNLADRHGLELDELYTYDNRDRVTSVKETYLHSSPLLVVWENYTDDGNGNQLSLSGTGGGATTSVYDANNRLWSRKDAQNRMWSYRYNKDGELTTLTYPDGEYATYLYDKDGRELSEVTKNSGGVLLESFVYTYDAVGNKKTMAEHRLYQSDRNIARCASAPEGGSGLGSDCTFDTDPAGLSPTSQSVTVSLRAIGSVYCTYDGCPYSPTITWYVKVVTGGNTVTYTLGSQSWSSASGTFDITKTGTISVQNGQAVYGNISYSVICKAGVYPCVPIKGVDTTVLTIFYGADEGLVTYVYDKQYRIAKVTYADGNTGTYTFDAVGDRLTDAETGACPPCSISYTYDGDHRLTQTTTAGGVVETFAYDANGNERKHTASPHYTSYVYDYENRLVSVSESYQAEDGGGCAIGVECTYRADPTDLAPSSQTLPLSLRAVGTAQGDETITWYAVQNGVATQMGTSYSCTSCAFDVTRTLSVTLHNGDTLYGEITFQEDSTHWVTTSLLRLTYAPTTTGTATYGYSGDGLRTTTTTPTGGTTYAANDPTGSGGLGQPTGTFTASGVLSSQTLYGPGTDDPIAQTTSSGTYFLHKDGQGSVTSVTDATQLQSSYRYNPYGISTEAAGPVSSPYRYAGGVWDAGSGLAYDRARMYDPSTGRFLSKDPMGGGYAYAADNPVNGRDPSGRSMWMGDDGGGGSGIGSVGTGGTYTSAFCDSWAVRAGLCIPDNNAPDATVTTTPPALATSPPKSASFDCQMSVATFVIDLFFTAIGIWGGLSGVQDIAYSLVTAWQWDTVANFLTGDVGGFLSLLLDVGWSLLTNYIVKQPWWAQLGLWGQMLGEFISQEWVINLVALGMQIAFGLAGIWQHCV